MNAKHDDEEERHRNRKRVSQRTKWHEKKEQKRDKTQYWYDIGKYLARKKEETEYKQITKSGWIFHSQLICRCAHSMSTSSRNICMSWIERQRKLLHFHELIFRCEYPMFICSIFSGVCCWCWYVERTLLFASLFLAIQFVFGIVTTHHRQIKIRFLFFFAYFLADHSWPSKFNANNLIASFVRQQQKLAKKTFYRYVVVLSIYCSHS